MVGIAVSETKLLIVKSPLKASGTLALTSASTTWKIVTGFRPSKITSVFKTGTASSHGTYTKNGGNIGYHANFGLGTSTDRQSALDTYIAKYLQVVTGYYYYAYVSAINDDGFTLTTEYNGNNMTIAWTAEE